jgi:hypothetical protein
MRADDTPSGCWWSSTFSAEISASQMLRMRVKNSIGYNNIAGEDGNLGGR